jgi:rod shape-determining protein MreC
MKEFFKGKAFKILVAVVVVIIGLLIGNAASGRNLSLPSDWLGNLTSPFQNFASALKGGFSGLGTYFSDKTATAAENEALKAQVAQLQQQLADYEQLKRENQQLKEIVGITEQREDLQMIGATVISGDSGEYYGAFTINKGNKDGIKEKDAVVTTAGVVGYVSEVSYNHCKVTTLLSPDCNIGGYDIVSGDFGVLTGGSELAAQGLFKLAYLPKGSLIAVGNIVVTSGLGGIFPQGFVAGVVQRVVADEQGLAMDAVLMPSADFSKLKEVLVVIGFNPEAGPTNSSVTASSLTASNAIPGVTSSGQTSSGTTSR